MNFSRIFFDRGGLRPYDGALMSNDLLPSQIDIRKLTTKGVEISSDFSPSVMSRLSSLLANTDGRVQADLSFYIDEDRKRRVDGRVTAQLNVVCQRCLEPVLITVNSDFNLAILWTDDEAKNLSRSLDPLIVGEELVDLADIVEEELILSLPIVSYHNSDKCQEAPLSFGEAENLPVEPEQQKENPFKVLAQLKPSEK